MEPTSYDLTVEQQFQMRLMEESARNMSQEQLADTLVQASRLIMLKDNVIRSLMKQVPIQSFGFEG
ncbi:MAG TPA: NblA/ycf18 family protein [Leptolyngbyaceae cyanobacterium M33_DOE_097]|uniref:Photosystem I reaction center subunit XII n=1 Tax=Oscillatoriales cyanobacterium SpSt-418 TaxID=2282169 RepID=A0A7C3PEZ8_9CYAN|nr:NblA/ycf18 family protein [Leptolyngbyaceae cyanobacterium M33_DOE_097]